MKTMKLTFKNGGTVDFVDTPGDKIIGMDLAPDLLERRGMTIHPTHRENEADLMHSRWFDYAGMHPVAATYLYAHHYKEQTRKFCETYVDIRSAEDAKAFTPDDIWFSRDLTSMWLARREADRLGLPYEFVMEIAQQRYVDKLFHRFPRPNQLYSEEFGMELEQAWKERIARGLVWSRKPQFQAAAFRGEPAQIKHVEFLVEQIKRRTHKPEGLIARMFREGVLSHKLAEPHFEEVVIDHALELAVRLAA
jgi:hypothetical protein